MTHRHLAVVAVDADRLGSSCVRYARPRRTPSCCPDIRRAGEAFLASLGGIMRISSSGSAPGSGLFRPSVSLPYVAGL